MMLLKIERPLTISTGYLHRHLLMFIKNEKPSAWSADNINEDDGDISLITYYLFYCIGNSSLRNIHLINFDEDVHF